MKQKTGYKHRKFVILECISGLGFGMLGDYFFSSFNEGDIAVSVFKTFMVTGISMIMGILLVGYFHYRAINRLNDFGRAIGLSFLGLIAFFILYIIVNPLAFKILPHYLSSVIFPIVMPFIGAVTGLNFIIINQKEGSSTRVQK
jgi:hypothetical protein